MNELIPVTGGLVTLLVTIGALLYFQPRWLLARLETWAPGVTYFAKTDQPVLALTIDDGPDPATTPRLLDILAQHEAHATFFLLSNRIQGCEEIVTRLVHEDHEIGNHLVEDVPSIQYPPGQFQAALRKSHQVLSKFSPVRWFRPGHGYYNRKMLAAIRELGYRCILGSVYPYDAQIPLERFAAVHILQNVSPGAIIVLHDGAGRGRRTIAVLEAILPRLIRRGYQIVTLSDLFERSERVH